MDDLLTRKEQEKAQMLEIKNLGLVRFIGYDLELEDTTICILVYPNTDTVEWAPAWGIAIKSPFDQLDRREGRIRSTARALRAYKRYKKALENEDPLYHDTQPIHTDRYKDKLTGPVGTAQRYYKLRTTYEYKSRCTPRLRSTEQAAVKDFLSRVKGSEYAA